MSPSQRTFSSVAMELARENSCRPPSTEDPKMARSARSALDLSKEAKIRVRGGGEALYGKNKTVPKGYFLLQKPVFCSFRWVEAAAGLSWGD